MAFRGFNGFLVVILLCSNDNTSCTERTRKVRRFYDGKLLRIDFSASYCVHLNFYSPVQLCSHDLSRCKVRACDNPALAFVCVRDAVRHHFCFPRLAGVFLYTVFLFSLHLRLLENIYFNLL